MIILWLRQHGIGLPGRTGLLRGLPCGIQCVRPRLRRSASIDTGGHRQRCWYLLNASKYINRLRPATNSHPINRPNIFYKSLKPEMLSAQRHSNLWGKFSPRDKHLWEYVSIQNHIFTPILDFPFGETSNFLWHIFRPQSGSHFRAHLSGNRKFPIQK